VKIEKNEELGETETEMYDTTVQLNTTEPNGFVCPKTTGSYSSTASDVDDGKDLYPNPENCHTYYHCSNDRAFLRKCPSNLVFNNKLKVCDFIENTDTTNCKL